MTRLERLSAILIKLQSKSVITAQQIAAEFDVSLRTIYRDIRALEEAGIPVASNAGVGYSLVDGYKLPPLMFTTEEAIAFLMAEKLVKKDIDKSSYNYFQSGMNKIKAVLRSVEKDLLASIDEYILVDEDKKLKPEPPDIIQPILQSIINKKCITIGYFTNHSQQHNKRTIEPIGIVYIKDSWYLVAYCLLRNGYRTFKLKRITEIEPCATLFNRKHPELNTLVKTLYCDEFSYNIVIRVQKDVLKHLADNMFFYGLYNEVDEGEYVRQCYSCFSLMHFARWYITFADHATIVEPPELKELLAQIIANIKV